MIGTITALFLIVGAWSHHFTSDALNEAHQPIGIEAQINHGNRISYFQYTNSFGCDSTFIGMVLAWRNFDLYCGRLTGYTNEPAPIIFPLVTVQIQRLNFSGMCVPGQACAVILKIEF